MYPVSLIKGLEIGEIPLTPSTPLTDKPTPIADEILLKEAQKLGYAISYSQEQEGRLIQNIVPVHKLETQQISSSSKVELEMHTEAAFHPFLPRWVLLLCLRGDSTAHTTYAIKDEILENLDAEVISSLKSNHFYTSIDDSFRTNRESDVFIQKQILSDDEKKITFDSALMHPIGAEAKNAIEKLSQAIQKAKRSIVLCQGELMIIDNHSVVHGRKPFQPKYNGFDRWIKRCLVVESLPTSEMNGKIITTRLENFAMSTLELSNASIAQSDRATDF